MTTLDHGAPYILTRPSILTPEECAEMRRKIDASALSMATVNTPRGPQLHAAIRNNERFMEDDHALAATLLERVREHAPPEVLGMRLCGVNERMRYFRYKPGTWFKPHSDGTFERDETERSLYTLIVYLNDDFDGGRTIFAVTPEVAVTPREGTALLFQHPIVHEGEEVSAGTKYALRTELMYARVG